MKILNSNDLRNWINNATNDWHERTDAELELMFKTIASDDHVPSYGTDWSEYLKSLDLEVMVS